MDIKLGYTPFVCSDCEDTLSELSVLYPEIIINSFQLGREVSLSKCQKDFIDILLLSKSAKLAASFLSTFSELVYYFSDTITDVVII